MRIIFFLSILAISSSCSTKTLVADTETPKDTIHLDTTEIYEKIIKSDKEWKDLLTPEQYYILRQKGTETAGTGKYNKTLTQKDFICAGCQLPLFNGSTKFDSGTGWPSFYQPISEKSIIEQQDGTNRIEVLCSRCEGHLGHVFSDGPQPTGLRYCINSFALLLDED